MSEPNNPLGLPDEAVTRRPSTLREMLGHQALPYAVVTLDDASWGALYNKAVGLRALPAGRQSQAVGAAIRWLTTEGGFERADVFTETGENALELEFKVQLLAAALVSADDPKKRLVDGPADVRELFLPEQVQWLFERYLEHQRERSPIKAMGPETIRQIAAELGKGYRPATSLKSYDAATLRSIVIELANQLLMRTTPPSSGTPSPTSSGD